MNTVFVENVKRIIADKGLKQGYVAEKVGLNAKQFSSLLNGRRCIDANIVVALANELDVTPNDLLGWGEKSA